MATPTELRAHLLALTERVINEVMDFGETTHEAGSWVREGATHHARHATAHLERARYPITSEGCYGDMTHALCRMAMAMYCYEQGDFGDHGAEGKGFA